MTDFEKTVLFHLKKNQKKDVKKEKEIPREEKLINELKKDLLQKIAEGKIESGKVVIEYRIPNSFSYEPYEDVYNSFWGDFYSFEHIKEFVSEAIKTFPSDNLECAFDFEENGNENDYSSKGTAIIKFILNVEKIKTEKSQ